MEDSQVSRPRPRNTKLKLLAVGDLNTGKTSILRRYVYKRFDNMVESTIGMDIATKSIKVEGIRWTVAWWDIAGQHRFVGLTKTYYRNALGAIVVVDITEKESLHRARKWKNDVDSKVFLPGSNERIPAILLANKWDLVDDNPELRQHSDQELDEFCKNNNFVGWFSTSAKTGQNIKKALQFIIARTVRHVLLHLDEIEHDSNLPPVNLEQQVLSSDPPNKLCSSCLSFSSTN